MHLVRANGRRILLDCGLFQGQKDLRVRNWEERVPDPRTIDAVVLSHVHVDHSGYLPLLARQGFRGPIFCTSGTADLLEIVLPDAAHLQEEEAERANRRGYTKHHPALPLYTGDDAQTALRLVQARDYDVPFPVVRGTSALLRRAGHILGSATVQLDIDGAHPTRLVYTGDLGRYDRPILRDPEPVPAADVLLLESTYGNRTHETGAAEQIAEIIRDTARQGGAILIPAFAVDRMQELLWMLHHLERAGAIPILPVYCDSPMAIEGQRRVPPPSRGLRRCPRGGAERGGRAAQHEAAAHGAFRGRLAAHQRCARTRDHHLGKRDGDGGPYSAPHGAASVRSPHDGAARRVSGGREPGPRLTGRRPGSAHLRGTGAGAGEGGAEHGAVGACRP